MDNWQDMKRLEGLADSLLTQHEGHQERLVHAQQKASDLIDILDSASSSAANLRTSIYKSLGWGSWWPYVFCPLTSLVVGSYGLPPSATRNLMLISLGKLYYPIFLPLKDAHDEKYVGEVAGFGVTIAKHYGNDIHTAFTSYTKVPMKANSTTAPEEVMFSKNGFANDEIWRLRANKSF